jgi:hypothetical protein
MARVREFVPSSDWWRLRVPSRQTLACLAVCIGVLVVAAIDLAHTDSRAPDLSSPTCQARPAGCFDEILRLQDQYESRCWLYSSLILASGAIAMAYALRVRPRTRWPRIFSDLGILGVWAGIGAVAALLVTSGTAIEVPAAPVLTIPIVLLVAAAIGTLVGRSEGWGEERPAEGVRERAISIGKVAIHVGTAGAARRSRIEQFAGWLSRATLALTAATVVLAIAFTIPQPDCGTGGGSPPGWTNPIDSIAAVTGVAAIAAAIGSLILRRWIAALISLVVNPIALLVIVAATCAFY